VKTLHTDTYPAIDPKQWNMHGKVVAITGASKGIGRAMAISYAQAGASGIAILARSSSGLSETSDAVHEAAKLAGHEAPKVVQIVADVTDETLVASAAHRVESSFGKLDILINNAAYLDGWKVIGESDPEDWWKSFVVNVKGTYLVTKTFLPLLIKSRDGMKTIVNVASIGANLLSHGGSGYQVRTQLIGFTPCTEHR
jgi:NAD(P)-dependent dehydrogenase (short-subunit alcohol dehydrogenase family)